MQQEGQVWDSWELLGGDQECKRNPMTAGSMSGPPEQGLGPQGSQMQHTKLVVLEAVN